MSLLNDLLGNGHMGSSTMGHADKDKDKNDDHGKPCTTPPGHMTAPGWLKNWGPNGKKDRDFPGKGRGSDDCVTTGTTTPPTVDMTAPIITGLAANMISTMGANIVWMTNENATSQVEYGTTTAYGSMTTMDSALMMSHNVSLMGLTPSTMYHFRVWSKDAANNTATSSDMSFMTVASDMTAPVISGTAVSGIGSTTAAISWNTNEAATGKVYYSTVTPVNLGTALMVNNATLVTTHMFNLTGLTASTTYYFVLESKDAANNTATTSSSSFMTN